MANPLIAQGTLNRLRGSVVYASYPQLNVIAPYLAKEAISIAFDGDTSLLLGTLTGAVTSPEPYTFGTVTMHLLRSQFLAEAYKAQIETNTTMGTVSIFSDSTTLLPFTLQNCILMSLQELTFDGTQPSFIVRLRGVYNVNATMWTLT